MIEIPFCTVVEHFLDSGQNYGKGLAPTSRDRCTKAAPGQLNHPDDRSFPIENRERIVNMAAGVAPMLVLDPAFLIALAALISSLSALIWAVRRKP